MRRRSALWAALLLSASPALASEASLLGKAKALYDAGDFKGAAQLYQEAVKQDPANADAKFGLGASEYQLKQYDQAAPAFEEAAQAGADRPDALYNLGNADFRANKLDEAQKAYIDALRLQPDAPDVRHNLAVTLLKKKQDKKNPQDKKDPKQNQNQNQNQNKQDNKQNQGGGDQKHPAPPRPKSGMSEEDAKRLLQAVKDREQSLNRPNSMMRKEKKQGTGGGEIDDW